MTQSRSVCSRIRNARASLDNAGWPPDVWAGGGLLRMEETPRMLPDYRDRQLQIKMKVRQAQIRIYLFPNRKK